MTEFVKNLIDDTGSLWVEEIDHDLESIVNSNNGTNATIVPVPRQRNATLRSWIWKWGVKEGKYW
jgi:hypothetical protein